MSPQTGDDDLEERANHQIRLRKDQLIRGPLTSQDLLIALQMIHQSLMTQADAIKDLIPAVRGIDASDLPAVLPVLRLVTGAASGTPSIAAEG